MKAKVTAKVANSPIMPVKEFIAEHVIEFDEVIMYLVKH